MADPTEIIARTICDFNQWDPNSGYARTGADRIIAALKAGGLVIVQDWRPIETAPKDGERILIRWPSERYAVCEAWWARPFEAAKDDQCWWQTAGGAVLPEHTTHWMPLPALDPTPDDQSDTPEGG